MPAAKRLFSPGKELTSGWSAILGIRRPRLSDFLDLLPGLRLSDLARRAYLRLHQVPQFPPEMRRRTEQSIGGPNAWIDSYGVLALSKLRFYAEPMREVLEKTNPWSELQLNVERARRWHPLNRGIWIAARVTLAGHLLQAKGDRVAMHSSVEVRYPFLDEDVFDFLAKLHPRWKLRGFRDKHLLRLLAERWLPPAIYRRGKVIFRAPLDSFHIDPEPAFVGNSSAKNRFERTGYFDVAAVHHWRTAFRQMRADSLPRLSVEMGLAAVVATQLWHHLFIDGDSGGVAHVGGYCGDGEDRVISAKLRERLATAALGLRIVFFHVRHGQPLFDKSPRFDGLPHLRVGSSQLDVVHQARRIDLDSFLKALYRLFGRCLRQFAVND